MSDPQRDLVSLQFTAPALSGLLKLLNDNNLHDAVGNIIHFATEEQGGVHRLTSTITRPQGETRILIGTPHLRPFEGWWVNSLMSVLSNAGPANCGVYFVEGRAVDFARQEILERGIEGNYTHVLFLDSDMLFPPWLIARLLRMDAPMASGLYFGRTRDLPVPHVYRHHHTEENGARWYKPLGNDVSAYVKSVDASWPETMCGPEPYVIEADAVGFGNVLIRTDLYRDWPKPWFETDEGGGGEDFAFCERARAAGAAIKVDLSIQCQHELRGGVFVGRQAYKEDWIEGEAGELDWNSDEAIQIEVGPFGRKRRPKAMVGRPEPEAAK